MQTLHDMFKAYATTIQSRKQSTTTSSSSIPQQQLYSESEEEPDYEAEFEHKVVDSRSLSPSLDGHDDDYGSLELDNDQFVNQVEKMVGNHLTHSSSSPPRSRSSHHHSSTKPSLPNSPKKMLRGDIQSRILSMEKEFDDLNGRYRDILSSMDKTSPQSTDHLVEVIKALQEKDSELRELKSELLMSPSK